jgi:hypothetical protein
MSSLLLEDEALKGRAIIERKKIEEFRIKGLSDIEDDLKEYDNWDGVTKTGSVAFRLDSEGAIFQNILHLVGSTEPKRFEAKVLFGKGYRHEGHQVKKYMIEK